MLADEGNEDAAFTLAVAQAVAAAVDDHEPLVALGPDRDDEPAGAPAVTRMRS